MEIHANNLPSNTNSRQFQEKTIMDLRCNVFGPTPHQTYLHQQDVHPTSLGLGKDSDRMQKIRHLLYCQPKEGSSQHKTAVLVEYIQRLLIRCYQNPARQQSRSATLSYSTFLFG